MKRKATLVSLALLLLASISGCGNSSSEVDSIPEGKAVLTIVGSAKQSLAFESIAAAFNKKYPNCSVNYKYLENYKTTLLTLLAHDTDSSASSSSSSSSSLEINRPASGIDMFVTENIQSDSARLPYALNLFSVSDQLDLSDTFDGLIKNFTLKNSEASGNKQIYAVPLGSEVRGLFVNKTLLKSRGIANVPSNRAELLSACETLAGTKMASGLDTIPFQGNPSTFSQWLMYPYVASIVGNAADYASVYAEINAHGAGVATKYFTNPMSFLYDLVSNNYYNYAYAEEKYGNFTRGNYDDSAMSFLNIKAGSDGSYAKVDDLGNVPFLSGVRSMNNAIEKYKNDYDSNIDYQFMMAPVGVDSGYGYLSPGDGIAVNKNTTQMAWTLKFMDFLFQKDNNKVYASKANIAPNTSDVYDTMKDEFNIEADHCCEVGSVTFDFDFYEIIKKTLTDISKANKAKYMIDNGDGTYTMHPLSYYMDTLEANFVAGKVL